MYTASYEIGAVYWQDSTSIVLADKGGPRFRPHLYNITLEKAEKNNDRYEKSIY